MLPERPALFLDRDGVINEDLGHVHRVEDFHFLPDVLVSCRKVYLAGYHLVVVTNQAGIAKGYYSVEDFENLSRWMSVQFRDAGAPLSGIYYCPHHPDGSVRKFRMTCDCRKPAPGLLLQARRELAIDMKRSILVGDKNSDVLAGQAAGIGHCYSVRHDADNPGLTHSKETDQCVTSFAEVLSSLKPSFSRHPAQK